MSTVLAIKSEFQGLSSDLEWRNFIEHDWNKRPAVLRFNRGHVIANVREIFQGMLAGSRRIDQANAPNIRFYVDETEVISPNSAPWLPVHSDRSYGEYVERICRTLGEKKFGIKFNDFQAFMETESWNKFRRFAHLLYSCVGIQPEHAGIELFAGNYRQSPFGLHKDTASLFCFVISGKKKMRFWPYEALSTVLPDDCKIRDYSKYIDRSIVLEAEPGEIIYWPASYWHVGEGDEGECPLTLHLTLNHVDQWSRLLALDALSLIGQKHESVALEELPYRANIPSQLRRNARTLKTLVSKFDYEKALVERWLRHVSGHGFLKFPPVDVRAIPGPQDPIVTNPEFPILVKKVGDELVVAANGRSVVVPYRAEFVRMIRKLNSGSVTTIAELTTRRPLNSSCSAAALEGMVGILWKLTGLSLAPTGKK